MLQHKNQKTYLLNPSKSKIQVCWAPQVALVVKNPPANTGDIRDAGSVPGWEGPLEEGRAAHSSVLAWRLLWAEKPGGLQSMGWRRVGND